MRDKSVRTPLLLGKKQSGQALIEYALILVLVAIGFGLALAATGPVLGNVFSNAIYHDLLRQTEIGYVPGREEFWLTVTAAAQKTPAEHPIPTNTQGAATREPTAGPSPTPSLTFTPSPTKPTSTPSPTPTSTDIIHNAPLYDSIDNPEWWRTDPNVFLGGLPWEARYFAGDFSGQVIAGANGVWEVNYQGEDWPGNVPAENFTARYTRTIGGPGVFASDTTLLFRATYDDGVRVTISSPEDPNCTSECVLIDDFAGGGAIRSQAKPQLIRANALYTVKVEYKQASGDRVVRIDIVKAGGSPDDTTAVNDGAFDCNWGRTDRLNGNDANTELYMWEEYLNGDLPANSRCYLEWRGAVNLASLSSPEMIFWDMWDLPAGVSGWVEIAEYVSMNGDMSVPVPNRAAFSWQRIDLRAAGTRNYNWTRNVIDLTNVNGVNFSGKYITYRFVIQNTNTNSGVRRWYIDDVQLREKTVKTFTLNHPVWNLNDTAQAADFITTGGRSNAGNISGWALVSNHKYGPSGMSWHDSVGPNDDQSGVAGQGNNGGAYTDYKRNTESPSNQAEKDLRIHTLEFAGWIDLQNVPPQDAQGNTGEPQLSFYHAYDVGGLTGLEIQYTTDGYTTVPAKWTTFTDGQIRSVTNPTGPSAPQIAMQEKIVSLANLPGNPQRIRIRFALSVHHDATRRDGWWIDQIRLGRAESPKWVDYPFSDNAQNFDLMPWRMTGQWTLTDEEGRPGISEPTEAGYERMSYASGEYGTNEETWLELKYPVDFNNDTVNKVFYNRAGINNTYNNPATRPMMTFYHLRGLGAGDEFRIEWKRIDEGPNAWKNLWFYRPLMAPNTPSPATIANIQLGWERVVVDLNPLMRILKAENTASDRDDDIQFRFVLKSDASVTGRGLNIDDLLIKEYEENVFRLWPKGESRNLPGGTQTLGNGNGVSYIDEADYSNTNRPWWQSWHNGGRWNSANWEAWTGVMSFHESPIGGQGRAPTGDDGVDIGSADWFYKHQTLSIMELDTIVDLRPVDAVNEAPALYFWSRYHIGTDDHILVQISTEMPGNDTQIDSTMMTRCGTPTPQCYEQVRGWTAWKTVWERPNKGGNGQYPRQEIRSYAWTREQIDLSPYAFDPASGKAGQRIRIRFVLDGLENGDNKDGWFIDNMTIQYRLPPQLPPIVLSEGGALDDSAQDLNNWVTEGRWGLDPTVFEGTGGAATSIGVWDYKWWDCATCESLASADTPANAKFAEGTKIFLQNPPAPDRSGQAFEINHNFGGGSPVAGWNKVDRIVGQWTLDTPVVGGVSFPSGSRSFMTRSDDAVRLFAQELDGSGQPVGERSYIVNNWSDHTSTVDMGAFNFQYGKRYRLTLQYYEKLNNGVITLTIGSGRFSFSDSPKFNVGPDVAAINYGNSSLTLRRVLDLRNMPAGSSVVLVHRTKYLLAQNGDPDAGNSDIARVEVSRDGGFSWTSNNLRDPLNPAPVGIPELSAPTYNGSRTTNWEERWNNLSFYKGSQIIIRFRLDRMNSWCARRGDCLDNATDDAARSQPMYYNGWWISRVRVLGT